MARSKRAEYANLANWWQEPDGLNTRWTWKMTPQRMAEARRLARSIESTLGIPVSVEQRGAMVFIKTGYRPNCRED